MKEKSDARERCPSGSFSYKIKSGDTLYLLARKYNTTVEDIMKINPGIKPENLQIGQLICIPDSSSGLPPCPNGFYYTIKSGDTFYRLSQQFGVNLDAIIRANPGVDPNNLQIGQVICIPQGAQPTPPPPSCPNGFLYTIRSGDTIYLLGQRYGVSVQAIINANPGIDPNNLQIGQVICIPSNSVPVPPTPAPPMPPTPPLPSCPNGVYYTIKPGDTIYILSQKFNVEVQEILYANPGIDPYNLQVGQVICIPRRCVIFCF